MQTESKRGRQVTKKKPAVGTERRIDLLKQSSAAIERKLDELAINHLGSADSAVRPNLSETLLQIISRALAEYRADSGLILEVHQKTGELIVKASLNLSAKTLTEIVSSHNEGVIRLVVAQGKPALVIDGTSNFSPFQDTAVGNAIFLPIMQKSEVVGVLALLYNAALEHKIDTHDFGVLALLANHAALAICNARNLSELRASYFNTVEALTVAIEAKDPYTRGHSARVAEYSIGGAQELGLPLDAMETLQTAAYLHDIGKIGIPGSILLKTGELSVAEFDILRDHPTVGAKILTPVTFYEDVVEIVEHHHERFDGTGYPFGKVGLQIPIGARVLALADAFDAMTSDRPYRKKLTVAGAISELERGANSQFDPNLVGGFVRALKVLAIKS